MVYWPQAHKTYLQKGMNDEANCFLTYPSKQIVDMTILHISRQIILPLLNILDP